MDKEYGKTWIYFPDGDGVPQIANITEPEDKTLVNLRGKDSLPIRFKVHFELYTRYADFILIFVYLGYWVIIIKKKNKLSVHNL